ncbi:MAG: glycosyltransferase [Prevotellaceae bacterium]|nr:glycosyltransferase [Prevotellaceae bacterium]
MKTYVCFKTHQWGAWQLGRFLKMADDLRLREGLVLVALFNGKEEDLPQAVKDRADDWLCYTAEDLLQLCKDGSYPSHGLLAHRRTIPQWTDAAASLLPVCLYYKKTNGNRSNQGQYYWHVEADAYFKGDWADFLNAFNDHLHDLLATHLCDDTTRMSWVKDTLKGYGLGNMPLRTALMSVSRVSGRLCEELLRAYRKGAEGHFEALAPTLCAHKYGDISMADIGDRFYTKTDPLHANVGTFGWINKNPMEEDTFKAGRIYHPVKWLCKDEEQHLTSSTNIAMNMKEKEAQKVSIVTTAYNVAQYIGQSVESSLGQTHPNLEVIVVEDCSSDGTGDILRQLEEKHPDRDKFRVVRNTMNQGAGMSRRIGIEHATGEYVLLLDGDDLLKPTFIENLMRNAEGADIVSGGFTILRAEGGYQITSFGSKTTEGTDRINEFWMEKPQFMSNKLIRRSLYDTVPYSSRRYFEDTPTIVPLLYLANKVRYVDETGYVYRQRQGSLTREASALENALFRALCVKDLIQWFSDKPREYRDLFRRSHFLRFAAQIGQQPREEIDKAPLQWPEEWREFIDCLKELEELRDSILK